MEYDEEEMTQDYSPDEDRQKLVDSDEMSVEEEAFMHGYDSDRDQTENQSVTRSNSSDDDEYDKAFSKRSRRKR